MVIRVPPLTISMVVRTRDVPERASTSAARRTAVPGSSPVTPPDPPPLPASPSRPSTVAAAEEDRPRRPPPGGRCPYPPCACRSLLAQPFPAASAEHPAR